MLFSLYRAVDLDASVDLFLFERLVVLLELIFSLDQFHGKGLVFVLDDLKTVLK